MRKSNTQRTYRRWRPRSADVVLVARINELARGGRNAWLAMLFTIVFVIVTTLGVQDIDFFVTERQTQLPLVGVSIPTNLFFWAAPAFVAALYANLHVHLMKLWEVVAEAPAEHGNKPLSDVLAAGFLLDLALSHRTDGALRRRPLAKLTRFFTHVLVFWATPACLAYVFWRSMPKLDEWLTILGSGIPLAFSVFIMLNSYRHLKRCLIDPDKRGHPLLQFCLMFALLTVTTTIGWFTTEGTTYETMRKLSQITWVKETLGLDEATLKALAYPNYSDTAGRGRQTAGNAAPWHWTMGTARFLVGANLEGADLAKAPASWRPYHVAKDLHRLRYCSDRDVPPRLCRPAMSSHFADPTPSLQLQRTAWCQREMDSSAGEDFETKCEIFFEEIEQNLAMDWLSGHNSAVPERSLFNADLRRANLTGARLQGLNLSNARLQGASLVGANLEGTHLIGANLDDTNLTLAQMQRALLRHASLKGATLSDAQLEEAILRYTVFDEASSFANTNLWFARLQGNDLTRIEVSFGQLDTAFGDGTVRLPSTAYQNRPSHWPETPLIVARVGGFVPYLVEYATWLQLDYDYDPPKRAVSPGP